MKHHLEALRVVGIVAYVMLVVFCMMVFNHHPAKGDEWLAWASLAFVLVNFFGGIYFLAYKLSKDAAQATEELENELYRVESLYRTGDDA